MGDQIKNNEGHWAVVCMMEKVNAYRILVGKPERKNNLENLDVDRMLQKWFLQLRAVLITWFVELLTV